MKTSAKPSLNPKISGPSISENFAPFYVCLCPCQRINALGVVPYVSQSGNDNTYHDLDGEVMHDRDDGDEHSDKGVGKGGCSA